MDQRTLTLGHSPDPDDAFMFYALAKDLIHGEKCPTRGAGMSSGENTKAGAGLGSRLRSRAAADALLRLVILILLAWLPAPAHLPFAFSPAFAKNLAPLPPARFDRRKIAV